VLGLFISYHYDVAAGGTIVLVATAIFALVWLFAPEHGFIATRVLRARFPSEPTLGSMVIFESPDLEHPPH
jgi:manganese/iron transport system permease protein